jgi:hypothetical protein
LADADQRRLALIDSNDGVARHFHAAAVRFLARLEFARCLAVATVAQLRGGEQVSRLLAREKDGLGDGGVRLQRHRDRTCHRQHNRSSHHRSPSGGLE